MGTTPKYGLPYPEPTTLITDSAAIVQQLAERIDLLISKRLREPLAAYTIPGTLLATLTASGSWTPPPGVTRVTAVIVGGGGGGRGGSNYYSYAYSGGPGGTGGGVIVADIDLDGAAVPYTIGGHQTATAFAGIQAAAGTGAPAVWVGMPTQAPEPRPWNLGRSQGGQGSHRASNGTVIGEGVGQDGVTITHDGGTIIVAGGGGGGRYGGGDGTPGGAGGGGVGGAGSWAGEGTNGTGGGGGGGEASTGQGGARGGTGVVYLFTMDPVARTRTPPDRPAVPRVVAALDDTDTMTGAYAVDPGLDLASADPRLVPYPDTPQDTGRLQTIPDDPDDPDGPRHEVPILEWPAAGWTYTNGTWTPPTKEVTP